MGAARAEPSIVRRFARMSAMLALVFVGFVQAQEPGPAFDPASSESVTSAALRAALLGDAEGARDIARARLDWEAPRRVKPEFQISERLAILAESSRRWLPSDAAAKNQMRGFPRSDATGAFRESLRASEPREVLRNASATRVYESRRRVFNSMISAVAGVFQLQFFGLVQLPLDAAESIVTGRPYLNPEQRRELRAARLVLEDRPSHAEAGRLVARYEARRVRLALAHAEANARRAMDQDRLETAQWWLQWARTLGGEGWVTTGELAELEELLETRGEQRLQSIYVREVEPDAREEAWVRWVLASLEQPAEAEGRTPLREFRGDPLGYDVRAAILAVRRQPATPAATLQGLEVLAEGGHPAWSARAQEMLDARTFDPVARVSDAKSGVSADIRRFVLWGTDPTIRTRTLTPETVRQSESALITGARSLFVFDILGRALSLPLMSPGTFPREGILEAAGSADPAFLKTPEAEPVLRAEARALSRSGRHAEAAAIWTRLENESAAMRSSERAAKRMERLARQAPNPEEQAAWYRRLMTGWPETPAARRAVKRLAEAEEQMKVMTLVTADEAGALEKAWTAAGWTPPPLTSKTQLRLLYDGTVQWRQGGDGQWQQATPDEEVFDGMIASLREVRLERQVAKVLDEPPERKRIPLSFEASAVPGVDFTPGLVPADIPGAERRLYE